MNDLPKVMIAHTYYRTGIEINFYIGMINTISTYNGPLDVQYLGMWSVAKARNQLVETFLKSDAEYLFFLDVDLGLPSYGLKQLVEHKLPVVGGLYFQRIPPHHPLLCMQDVFTKEFHQYIHIRDYKKGLVQVDATGAGCLLIHRDVFKKIKKPYFYDPPYSSSEDFYFCEKLKAKGIPLYVDTNVILSHSTETLITEKDKERYDRKF